MSSSVDEQRRVIPIFTDRFRTRGDALESTNRETWHSQLVAYVDLLSQWPLKRNEVAYRVSRFASFTPLYDTAFETVQHAPPARVRENGGYLVEPFVYVTALRVRTVCQVARSMADKIYEHLHSDSARATDKQRSRAIADDLVQSIFSHFEHEPQEVLRHYAHFVWETYIDPVPNAIGFVYSTSDDQIVPQAIQYLGDDTRTSSRQQTRRGKIDRRYAEQVLASVCNDRASAAHRSPTSDEHAATVIGECDGSSKHLADSMLVLAALRHRPLVVRELRDAASRNERGRLVFIKFDEHAALEYQPLNSTLREDLDKSPHKSTALQTLAFIESYDPSSAFVASVYEGPPLDSVSFRTALRRLPWRQCSACRRASEHADLQHCARCRWAWYCDATCQRRHWREHKSYCRELAP